jgi:hypothetical protein
VSAGMVKEGPFVVEAVGAIGKLFKDGSHCLKIVFHHIRVDFINLVFVFDRVSVAHV